MVHRDLKDAAALAELLRYDPETGHLWWKERPGDNRWNARWAGSVALNCIASDTGYRVGSVHKRRTYAHRAAYALMTGRWPVEVDHINGDRADNRWTNLREVDRSGQRKNSKLRDDNKSGTPGVDQMRNGRWRARIYGPEGEISLGTYATAAEATAARRAAEAVHGYHANHGRTNR